MPSCFDGADSNVSAVEAVNGFFPNRSRIWILRGESNPKYGLTSINGQSYVRVVHRFCQTKSAIESRGFRRRGLISMGF